MRRLILPILVLGAAIAADRLGMREKLPERVVENLSRAVFVLVFLLAWRFRRGRVAWAVAMVAALAEATRSELLARDVLTAAAALLVPLNLAVLGPLRDWRVGGWTGAWRLAVLAAEAGAVLAVDGPVVARLQGMRDWLTATASPLAGGTAALAAFSLAAAALVAAFVRRRGSIEAGLLGALAAAYPALAGGGVPATYYLAVAGLVLGLALVENAFSLAFEDGLTGLPARRALEEALVHLGGTYAIAMLDLDHFKKLNDRHGHEVGDQVLQMVASKLGRVGGGGRAFRYGGEEFTVVFPGKSAAEAEPFVEELRATVAESPFTVRSPARPKRKPKEGRGTLGTSKKLRVTVSVGLAERSDKNRLPEQVMKAADKALYRAKKAGRNRMTKGR